MANLLMYLLVGAPGCHRDVNGLHSALPQYRWLTWELQLVAVLHLAKRSVDTGGRYLLHFK